MLRGGTGFHRAGGPSLSLSFPKYFCFPAPSRSQPSIQARRGDHPGTATEHSRPALRAGPGRWEAGAGCGLSNLLSCGVEGRLPGDQVLQHLVCR